MVVRLQGSSLVPGLDALVKWSGREHLFPFVLPLSAIRLYVFLSMEGIRIQDPEVHSSQTLNLLDPGTL